MSIDIFTVIDPVRRICGFMTRGQLYTQPEDVAIEGRVAKLESRPTRQRRSELLMRSLNNGTLSSAQRTIVQKELEFLTDEQHGGWSQTLRRGGEVRYVTRDTKGVFLGVHSELSARSRWEHVVRMGWTLLVNEEVPVENARVALRSAGALERPSLADSDRVSASIAAAAHLLDGRDDTDVFAGARNLFVYVDADDSYCTLTLSKLNEAFGVG